MRDLRLYLDSKLKNLNLFSTAQKIITDFTLDPERIEEKIRSENLSAEQIAILEERLDRVRSDIANSDIPNKKFALNVYSDFIDLAKLSDEYNSWGEAEWNNFITMMNLAFKEKGRGIALTNALCAISGIILSKPVEIEDTDEGTYIITHVRFEIEQLSTPFTSRFKQLVEKLLPKLYWVHHISLEPAGTGELFKNITVKVDDSVTYEKNLYASPKFFCDNRSSITGINQNNWGID